MTSELNPYATTNPRPNGPLSAEDMELPTGDQRLMSVAKIREIPTADLWSMANGTFQFVLLFLLFKVFRLNNQMGWAAAFLDQMEVTDADIPPRWRSDFETMQRQAEGLGFRDVRYVTTPTIGPRMTLEMLMTTSDGRIQLSFVRRLTKENHVKLDETDLALYSRLAGGRSLLTRKRGPNCRPSDWQNIKMVRTKSLEKLLQIHRDRLAQEAAWPIHPSDLVSTSIAEDVRILQDMLRRGILRETTPEEVLAIQQAANLA